MPEKIAAAREVRLSAAGGRGPLRSAACGRETAALPFRTPESVTRRPGVQAFFWGYGTPSAAGATTRLSMGKYWECSAAHFAASPLSGLRVLYS